MGTWNLEQLWEGTLRQGESTVVTVNSKETLITETGTSTSTYKSKDYVIKLTSIFPQIGAGGGLRYEFSITVSDGTSTTLYLDSSNTAGVFKKIRIELDTSQSDFEKAHIRVYCYRYDSPTEIFSSSLITSFEEGLADAFFVDADGNLLLTKKLAKGEGADFYAPTYRFSVEVWDITYTEEFGGGMWWRYITFSLGVILPNNTKVYVKAFETKYSLDYENWYTKAVTPAEIADYGLKIYCTADNTITYCNIRVTITKTYTPEKLASFVLLRSKYNISTREVESTHILPVVVKAVFRVKNSAAVDWLPYYTWNGMFKLRIPPYYTNSYSYAYGKPSSWSPTYPCASAPQRVYKDMYGWEIVEFDSTLPNVAYSLPDVPDENIAYYPHDPSTDHYRPILKSGEEVYVVASLAPNIDLSKPQQYGIRGYVEYETYGYIYPSEEDQGYIPIGGLSGNKNLKLDDCDRVRFKGKVQLNLVNKVWDNVHYMPDWEAVFILSLSRRGLKTGAYYGIDDLSESVAHPVLTFGTKFTDVNTVAVALTATGNVKFVVVNPDGSINETKNVPFSLYTLPRTVGKSEITSITLHNITVKIEEPGTGKIVAYGILFDSSGLGYIVSTEYVVSVSGPDVSLEIELPADTMLATASMPGFIKIRNNGSSPISVSKLTLSISGPLNVIYEGRELKELTTTVPPVEPGDETAIPIVLVWDGSSTGAASITVALEYTFESGTTETVVSSKAVTVSGSPVIKTEYTVESEFTRCGSPAKVKFTISNVGTVDAEDVTVSFLLFIPELSRYHLLDEYTFKVFPKDMTYEVTIDIPILGYYTHYVIALARYREAEEAAQTGLPVTVNTAVVVLNPPDWWVTIGFDPHEAPEYERCTLEVTVNNPVGSLSNPVVKITIPSNVRVVDYGTTPSASVSISDSTYTFTFTESAEEYSIRLVYYPWITDDTLLMGTASFTIEVNGVTCNALQSIFRVGVAPNVRIRVKTDKPIASPGDIVTVNVEVYPLPHVQTYIADSTVYVAVPKELSIVDAGDWDVRETERNHLLSLRSGVLRTGEKYTFSFTITYNGVGVFIIPVTLSLLIPEYNPEIEDWRSIQLKPHFYEAYGTIVFNDTPTNLELDVSEELMYPEGRTDTTTIYDYDMIDIDVTVLNYGTNPLIGAYMEITIPEGMAVQTHSGEFVKGPATVRDYFGDVAPYGYQGCVRTRSLTLISYGGVGEKTVTINVKGRLPDGSEYTLSWSKTYNVVKAGGKVKPIIIIPWSTRRVRSTRRVPATTPLSVFAGFTNTGRGFLGSVEVKVIFPSEARIFLAYKVYQSLFLEQADEIGTLYDGRWYAKATFTNVEPETLVPGSIGLAVIGYWTIDPRDAGRGLETYVTIEYTNHDTGETIVKNVPVIVYNPDLEVNTDYVENVMCRIPKAMKEYYDLRLVRNYASTFRTIYSWCDTYTGGVWIFGKPKDYPQSRMGYGYEEEFPLVENVGVRGRATPLGDGTTDNDYFG